MVSHATWITWASGARTGVNLNVIRDAAPFSMDFYRQFARDTFDNDPGAPFGLLRWTTAPSFYVRTVDQNGRAMEPEVLVVTLDALRRAVPAFTGGTFSSRRHRDRDRRPAAGRRAGSTSTSGATRPRSASAASRSSAPIPARSR